MLTYCKLGHVVSIGQGIRLHTPVLTRVCLHQGICRQPVPALQRPQLACSCIAASLCSRQQHRRPAAGSTAQCWLRLPAPRRARLKASSWPDGVIVAACRRVAAAACRRRGSSTGGRPAAASGRWLRFQPRPSSAQKPLRARPPVHQPHLPAALLAQRGSARGPRLQQLPEREQVQLAHSSLGT